MYINFNSNHWHVGAKRNARNREDCGKAAQDLKQCSMAKFRALMPPSDLPSPYSIFVLLKGGNCQCHYFASFNIVTSRQEWKCYQRQDTSCFAVVVTDLGTQQQDEMLW